MSGGKLYSFKNVATLMSGTGKFAQRSILVGELPDGSPVNLPVMVSGNSSKGPKVLITSTIHGDEVAGIEVIRRILRKDLDSKQIQGMIIAIPVANPLAFQQISHSTPRTSFGDLNRSFPGNSQGAITERLAHLLWKICSEVDLIIDLHCLPVAIGNGFVQVRTDGNVSINSRSISVARSFGLTVVLSNPKKMHESNQPPTIQTLAMSNSIPAILVELNDWKGWREETVECGERGVLNVLKFMRMISGMQENQDGFVVKKMLQSMMITANHGGLVRRLKESGARVKKGEHIASIYSVYGEELERLTSPVNGFVLAFPESQVVSTGDSVINLGTLL